MKHKTQPKKAKLFEKKHKKSTKCIYKLFLSRILLCILFHFNFFFNGHLFSSVSHFVMKISIYNGFIIGIYTYSCIYEYILILSTLVYVCNAKKVEKYKKNRFG